MLVNWNGWQYAISGCSILCVTYCYLVRSFLLCLCFVGEVPCINVALSDYSKKIYNYSHAMHAEDVHANISLTMWLGKSQFSLLYSVRLTEITCLSKGTAQLQSCYDATGCGGSAVTAVSTARNCCLGSGLSFRNGSGICRQCIGKQLRVRGIYLVCRSNLASEDKVSLPSYE